MCPENDKDLEFYPGCLKEKKLAKFLFKNGLSSKYDGFLQIFTQIVLEICNAKNYFEQMKSFFT